MGVRFRSTFKSTFNHTEYKCEIWDSTYSSTITNIITEGEGFEITYQQQGDERFTPIKGSECSLYCVITNDSAGTLLKNWITTSLNATKEDLYHIAIYKDSSLHWFGVILPDLNNQMDISRPYGYKITATDGLARMKDKEFTLAVSAYNDPSIGRKTFNEIIFDLLKYSPLYTATTENLLWSTIVGWYEDGMPAKAANVDPLSYSKIRENTYVILKENKEPEGMTYWEVLENICYQWGMRVMFSDGLYRFYQVNAYEDDAITKYERYYLRGSGAYDGFRNFIGDPIEITNDDYPYVKSGNQFAWYAPLKFVRLKYPFKNTNMLDSESDMTEVSGIWTYSKTIRDNIIAGSNTALRFNTFINFKTSSIYPLYVTISIKLKIGSNYLKKSTLTPLGGETWTGTSTDRWEHVYDIQWKTPFSYRKMPLIEFVTPGLPPGTYDSNEFKIEFVSGVVSIPGWGTGSVAIIDANREKGSTFLEYLDTGASNEQQYIEFIAGNSATPINSYDLELPDALIGEQIDLSNPGQILVYNGTAWGQSTGQWRYEDTGAALSFNLLRVREVLTGQTIPIEKYQGALIGSVLLAHNSIEYNGYRYILNGATFKAQSDTWEGEWYQVSIDRLSFEDIGGSEPQTGDGGTQGLLRSIGGAWNDGNTALKQIAALNNERVLTFTTAPIPIGAQTSFDIEPTHTDLIKEGDFIRIITANGTASDRVRVSADVGSTDTSISIDSYTFALEIPINSILAWDMERTVLNYLRLGPDFPTSDPSIYGVAWWDTSTHHMKISNG